MTAIHANADRADIGIVNATVIIYQIYQALHITGPGDVAPAGGTGSTLKSSGL
jgi:hypothetical protein